MLAERSLNVAENTDPESVIRHSPTDLNSSPHECQAGRRKACPVAVAMLLPTCSAVPVAIIRPTFCLLAHSSSYCEFNR
jgi:hypothetical protein